MARSNIVLTTGSDFAAKCRLQFDSIARRGRYGRPDSLLNRGQVFIPGNRTDLNRIFPAILWSRPQMLPQFTNISREQQFFTHQ
jgi:hypothetical protein